MNKKNLDVFRKRLLAEKSRVLEQLERAEANLQQYETDFSELISLRNRQRYLQENLEEISKALGRIENGTYGLSEISGKPIPLERLELLPWASRLVEEGAGFPEPSRV
jgi:RNA polymerase-binding transcription factor DksA